MTCARCGEALVRVPVRGHRALHVDYCPRCGLAKSWRSEPVDHLWIDHGGEG